MASKYGSGSFGGEKDQQPTNNAEPQGRAEELEGIYGSIDSRVRDALKIFLATTKSDDLNISRGEIHYPTYSSEPPHLAICWNVGEAYEQFRGSRTTPMIYPMRVFIKYDEDVVLMSVETQQSYIFSGGNMSALRKKLEQVTGLRAR